MKEKLAIDGGKPVRTEPFPAWPVYDEDEIEALTEVVKSGKWGALAGDKVMQFERAFASFQQAKFGLCVVNGTAALEVSMRALGIGPGDEVITTPYTFIATPNAAILVGAVPVFVDIDPDTYMIDARLIEGAITERTRAIMPVHLAGCPADMDAILDIAQQHRLFVIEDACQAWGAEWKGRKVGAIGNMGTFSFQSSKNITAGEGGIIVTNDSHLSELAWSLHNIGRCPTGEWYGHLRVGWNYRMTEWQGAVLLVQFGRLPQQMARRDENAAYLTEQLGQIPGIQPLKVDERVTHHSWHLFILRYDANAFNGLPRHDFIAALCAEGIPCSSGYWSLTRAPAILNALSAMGASSPQPCPVSDRACDEEGVWLQQNLLLGTETDMDSIVEAMAKIQAVRS
jgi:dTDP-4-amino-4,6-dideoxygalactose transaminase